MNEQYTIIVQSNGHLEFVFGPYPWEEAGLLVDQIKKQLETNNFPYPLNGLAGRTVNIRKLVPFPK